MRSILRSSSTNTDKRSLRARTPAWRFWALLALLPVTGGTDAVAQVAMQAVIHPTNQIWRYHTNRVDPGPTWMSSTFDDSTWPEGRGLFGNENNYPYPVATFIPGSFQGPLTAYFRTRFHWPGSTGGAFLFGTNYVDDGCVIYLNGVEISRFNMPAGVPDYNTLAVAANPGGYPNLNNGEPVLVRMEIPLGSLTNGNPNPLQQGENVLAVEVHNNSPASSDVLFGMSLFDGHVDWHLCVNDQTLTNRTVLEHRPTTFTLNVDFCVSMLSYQWYRDVGFGEEAIAGATGSSFTLTDPKLGLDQGAYYCRVSSASGTRDTRQASLIVLDTHDTVEFVLAFAGAGLNKFRLITSEPMCGDWSACGGDFSTGFNWEIVKAGGPEGSLTVESVTQINDTTYEFTTVEPRDPNQLYLIKVPDEWSGIGDLFGHLVAPGTAIGTLPAVTFKQGLNGYSGTHDASVHSGTSEDTPLGTQPGMKTDLDDAGTAQALLRFDHLIGGGSNRIPTGTVIRHATLKLHLIDPGSAVGLHRVLVGWDQSTVTWNSLINGITPDGVEAEVAADAVIPTGTPGGVIELDVTTSVAAWMNGRPNFGWSLLSTGSDACHIATVESGIATAPELTVVYDHPDDCSILILNQPPSSLVPAEGATVAITVNASVTGPQSYFQWTRDGTDVPGADQITLLIQDVSPLDAGTYRLRIGCGGDPARDVLSNPCELIIGHNERPYLTQAGTSADNVTITLGFSERLDETSAENLANYTFTPALAVISAVLSNEAAPPTVTLTTAPRDPGSRYTLSIAGLDDLSLSTGLITPNPTLVPLTSARVVLPWTADAWSYHTNNLDAATDWHQPSFIPGPDWATGRGLFGAENSQAPLLAAPAAIATPLLPNNQPESPDNRVTIYFRREVSLPPLEPGTSYFIRHFADDGFIAYLDGVEIHRFAMPAGAVRFATRSTGIPTGDATRRSFPFEATPGTHTLAVELHQAGVNSSDVLFGMEISIVNGPVPTLSIHRAWPGLASLLWSADDSWQLRSANSVQGPYLDAPIQPFTPLGHFTVPAPSTGNASQFFRLDYTGPRR